MMIIQKKPPITSIGENNMKLDELRSYFRDLGEEIEMAYEDRNYSKIESIHIRMGKELPRTCRLIEMLVNEVTQLRADVDTLQNPMED